MEVKGVFTTYELTKTEKDTFALYLQHYMNTPFLELIKYFLGDDYLKFIDVMSGMCIKIPSQKTLEKELEAVQIFLFLKKNKFSEESIKIASKSYKKTVLMTKKNAYRVAKELGVEDTLDGVELENYIANIKKTSSPNNKNVVKNEYEELSQA